MKILMLSLQGDGLGIAHQLVREGHDVDMFIKNPQYKHSGKGIVNRVDSWRPHVQGADFVVCDMVGFGYEDVLRRFGRPFIGCNKIADMMELDREKGIDLMRRVGINTPPTVSYDSPREARDALEDWSDLGKVIKPSGNIETGKTYLAQDRETFEWALQQYDKGQKLIIQDIVDGVEVSTEGWFNGRDWIRPFNHTFEEKRLLDDGIGPNTGCMGNVVLAAHKDNRLAQETVMKLKPFLAKASYRGPVDVNCIVTESSVYALEITARFGYDAIEALMEGLKEPVLDVLFETATGIKKEMDITSDYMIAVRLSTPPWPSAEPDQEDRGMPILGLHEKNLKHLFLTDVQKAGDEYLYAAGDGVLCKATARGRDMQEARNRVYNTVSGIRFMDKQYRQDIGARVNTDLGKLKSWGWLDS